MQQIPSPSTEGQKLRARATSTPPREEAANFKACSPDGTQLPEAGASGAKPQPSTDGSLASAGAAAPFPPTAAAAQPPLYLPPHALTRPGPPSLPLPSTTSVSPAPAPVDDDHPPSTVSPLNPATIIRSSAVLGQAPSAAASPPVTAHLPDTTPCFQNQDRESEGGSFSPGFVEDCARGPSLGEAVVTQQVLEDGVGTDCTVCTAPSRSMKEDLKDDVTEGKQQLDGSCGDIAAGGLSVVAVARERERSSAAVQDVGPSSSPPPTTMAGSQLAASAPQPLPLPAVTEWDSTSHTTSGGQPRIGEHSATLAPTACVTPAAEDREELRDAVECLLPMKEDVDMKVSRPSQGQQALAYLTNTGCEPSHPEGRGAPDRSPTGTALPALADRSPAAAAAPTAADVDAAGAIALTGQEGCNPVAVGMSLHVVLKAADAAGVKQHADMEPTEDACNSDSTENVKNNNISSSHSSDKKSDDEEKEKEECVEKEQEEVPGNQSRLLSETDGTATTATTTDADGDTADCDGDGDATGKVLMLKLNKAGNELNGINAVRAAFSEELKHLATVGTVPAICPVTMYLPVLYAEKGAGAGTGFETWGEVDPANFELTIHRRRTPYLCVRRGVCDKHGLKGGDGLRVSVHPDGRVLAFKVSGEGPLPVVVLGPASSSAAVGARMVGTTLAASAIAEQKADGDEGRAVQKQQHEQGRIPKAVHSGSAGGRGSARAAKGATATAGSVPDATPPVTATLLLRTPSASEAQGQSPRSTLKATTGPPKIAAPSSSSSPRLKKPHGGGPRRSVPSGLPNGVAGGGSNGSPVAATKSAAAAAGGPGGADVPSGTTKVAGGKRRRSEPCVGGGSGCEVMPPPPPPPFLPLAVRPRRERKEDRDRDALARMARQQQVVVATIQGPVFFEMLPPYDTAPSMSRKQQYRQLRNLLLAAFPDNKDEVTEGVYRGREPGSSAVNESRDNVTCLAAGLWLGGDVVCAALVRMNTDSRSPDHLQVMFHATQPSFCRHGLGRLLIRCVQTVAAHEGHKYMSVVVGNDSVEQYWSLTDFQAVHQHADPPDLRGVWLVSSERPPRGTIWVAQLAPRGHGARPNAGRGEGGSGGSGAPTPLRSASAQAPQALVSVPTVQSAARLAEERFARAPVGVVAAAAAAAGGSCGTGGGHSNQRDVTATGGSVTCNGSAAAPAAAGASGSGPHHRRSSTGGQQVAKTPAASAAAAVISPKRHRAVGPSDVSRQTNGSVVGLGNANAGDVVAADVIRVFCGIAHPRRWIVRQAFKVAAEALEQDVAASGQEDVMVYFRMTADGAFEPHRAKLKISKIGNYMIQSIGPLLSRLRDAAAARGGEEGASGPGASPVAGEVEGADTTGGGAGSSGSGRKARAAKPGAAPLPTSPRASDERKYFLSLLADGRALLEYKTGGAVVGGPQQASSPQKREEPSPLVDPVGAVEVEVGLADVDKGEATKTTTMAGGHAGTGDKQGCVGDEDVGGKGSGMKAGRRGTSGSADAGGSGGGSGSGDDVAVAAKTEASDGNAAAGIMAGRIAAAAVTTQQQEGGAVAAAVADAVTEPSAYGSLRFGLLRRCRVSSGRPGPVMATAAGGSSAQDTTGTTTTITTTSSDQSQPAATNRNRTGPGARQSGVGTAAPAPAVSKGTRGDASKKRTAAAAGGDDGDDKGAGGTATQADGKSTDKLPTETLVRQQKGQRDAVTAKTTPNAAAKHLSRDTAATTQPQSNKPSSRTRQSAQRIFTTGKQASYRQPPLPPPPPSGPPVPVADAPPIAWLPYGTALIRARNATGDVTSSIIIKDRIMRALLGGYTDTMRVHAAKDRGITVWLQPHPYDVYYMLPARLKYYETDVPPGAKASLKNPMWNLLSSRSWLKAHMVHAVVVRVAIVLQNGKTAAVLPRRGNGGGGGDGDAKGKVPAKGGAEDETQGGGGPLLPSTEDVVAGRVRFVMIARASPVGVTEAVSGGGVVPPEVFGAVGVMAVAPPPGGSVIAATTAGTTAPAENGVTAMERPGAHEKQQKDKQLGRECGKEKAEKKHGEIPGAILRDSPRDDSKLTTSEVDAADPWIGPVGPKTAGADADAVIGRKQEQPTGAVAVAVAIGDLSPTSMTAAAVSGSALQTSDDARTRVGRRRVREEDGGAEAGTKEDVGLDPSGTAVVDGAAGGLKGRGKAVLKAHCTGALRDRQQQQQQRLINCPTGGDGASGGGGGGIENEPRHKRRRADGTSTMQLQPQQQRVGAGGGGGGGGPPSAATSKKVAAKGLGELAATAAAAEAERTLLPRSSPPLPVLAKSPGMGVPLACGLENLAAALAQELDLDASTEHALSARLRCMGAAAVMAVATPFLGRRDEGGVRESGAAPVTGVAPTGAAPVAGGPPGISGREHHHQQQQRATQQLHQRHAGHKGQGQELALISVAAEPMDVEMEGQSPPSILVPVSSPSTAIQLEQPPLQQQQRKQQLPLRVVVRWVPGVPALVGLKLQMTLPSGSIEAINWHDVRVTAHFGELMDNVRLAEEEERAAAVEYLGKLTVDPDPIVDFELQPPRNPAMHHVTAVTQPPALPAATLRLPLTIAFNNWMQDPSHSMLLTATVPLNTSTAVLLPSTATTTPALTPALQLPAPTPLTTTAHAASPKARTAAAAVESPTGPVALTPASQPQPLDTSLQTAFKPLPSPPRPWPSVPSCLPLSLPAAHHHLSPQPRPLPTLTEPGSIHTSPPEGQPLLHPAIHPTPTATNPPPSPRNPLSQPQSRPEILSVSPPEEVTVVTATNSTATSVAGAVEVVHANATKRPRLSTASPLPALSIVSPAPLTATATPTTGTATADGGRSLSPTHSGANTSAPTPTSAAAVARGGGAPSRGGVYLTPSVPSECLPLASHLLSAAMEALQADGCGGVGRIPAPGPVPLPSPSARCGPSPRTAQPRVDPCSNPAVAIAAAAAVLPEMAALRAPCSSPVVRDRVALPLLSQVEDSNEGAAGVCVSVVGGAADAAAAAAVSGGDGAAVRVDREGSSL